MTTPTSGRAGSDPAQVKAQAELSLAANLLVSSDADASAEGTTINPNALGASLRRLREARGWSVAEVSARLKFSERQVAALEAEHWAQLPVGLSLRGLIRNYARLLGADAQVLLAALTPQLDAAGRVPLASARAAQLLAHDSAARRWRGWLVAGLLALVLLVAWGVWVWGSALGWWPPGSAAANGSV